MPHTITKSDLLASLDLMYRCAIESELYASLTPAERGDIYDTIKRLETLLQKEMCTLE